MSALTGSQSDLVYVPHDEVYGSGIEDMLHRPSIDKVPSAVDPTPQRILDDVVAHAKSAPAVDPGRFQPRGAT